MAHRNTPFEVEQVEQLALIDRLRLELLQLHARRPSNAIEQHVTIRKKLDQRVSAVAKTILSKDGAMNSLSYSH